MSRGTLDWYRRPEMILAEMVREAARGPAPDQTFRRALVLAVDYEGGRLQNESGTGQVKTSWPGQGEIVLPALVGPRNPRGSIKARILTDGFDRLRSDQECRVFWPMFSVDNGGAPVSPGEHVFVVFEGSGFENGLWMVRVPGHDGPGAFIGKDSYTAPSVPGSAMDHFEENPSELIRDDHRAGLAPGRSAVDFFEDE